MVPAPGANGAPTGARKVSRRTVLGGLAIGAAALLPTAAGSVGLVGPTSAPEVERIAERLGGILTDSLAARRLGAAYLETLARRPAPTEIVRDLLGPGTTVATASGLDDATLRDLVRRQHRADLRAGRFYLYESWFYSHTAGRLAALTAAA